MAGSGNVSRNTRVDGHSRVPGSELCSSYRIIQGANDLFPVVLFGRGFLLEPNFRAWEV